MTLVNRNPYGNGTALFTRLGRRGPRLRAGRSGRHGRHQRADSRADGVLLVRRLEAVALRRPARARHGRHQVLHAHEGRDAAVDRGSRGRHRSTCRRSAEPSSRFGSRRTAAHCRSSGSSAVCPPMVRRSPTRVLEDGRSKTTVSTLADAASTTSLDGLSGATIASPEAIRSSSSPLCMGVRPRLSRRT